jgi:hypothetical protein
VNGIIRYKLSAPDIKSERYWFCRYVFSKKTLQPHREPNEIGALDVSMESCQRNSQTSGRVILCSFFRTRELRYRNLNDRTLPKAEMRVSVEMKRGSCHPA